MQPTIDKDRSRINILVIEDEDYARECISDFLELVGFSAVQARNGREGVELFGKHEPNIVITDIKMPVMDGFDILKFVQAYSAETPVIVISGTSSLDDVAQCLKLGAWDYIVKPVYDYGVLEMSVLRVLEKKQLIEENRRYREYLEEEVIKRSDELLSSAVRFKTLFNLASDVLFIHDRDGKIVDCNEAAVRQIGYGRKQLLEMNMRDLILPDDAGHFERVMARLPRAGSVMYELRCAHKSGAVSVMELHATMVTAEAAPLVFVICRDVSERRRMEQEREDLKAQVEAAQRVELVGMLVSGIAHDFNNVLTALSGYASLLRMDAAKAGAPLLGYAEKITDIAAKGQGLTARLMSFIRKKREELVPVDIHKVLTETEQLLRPNSESINIELDLDAKRSVVLGGDSQIQSVFLNLGLNARDAMPGGGTLTFRTYNEERCVGSERKGCGFIGIDVIDTGTGIEEKFIGKIFEPLFTTKLGGAGTGIGLPSVLYCVKNMHGGIEVDSKAGVGTTFKISLPLYDGGTPQNIDLSGKQVLIVTEDIGLIKRMRDRLALERIDAKHVTDPEAALEWIRENADKTATVIVDYDLRMYDENGFINAVDDAASGMLVIKMLSKERIALGSNKNYTAFVNVSTDSDMFFESIAMYIRDRAEG
ncbi:MAG: response regulator [Chitinispirillales bacterium]|jgi:PAS domain S-box-containing protein|nr:response regulator [Chitinispirillales bacterium]